MKVHKGKGRSLILGNNDRRVVGENLTYIRGKGHFLFGKVHQIYPDYNVGCRVGGVLCMCKCEGKTVDRQCVRVGERDRVHEKVHK